MPKTGPGKSLKEMLSDSRGKMVESEKTERFEKEPTEEILPEKKEARIEVPEKKVEAIPEVKQKEVVKEREQVQEKQKTEEEALKAKKAPPAKVKKGIADDVAIILALDEPKQIKTLVYLALTKGLHHAYDVARSLDNPYLLDKFHDSLIDEMRETLIKRGKLKQDSLEDKK